MAQSLTIDWLNENEFRSYPLKLARNREVLVTGFGRISPGAYDSNIGGYLINGLTDTNISPQVATRFLDQISPGDQIQVEYSRATVLTTALMSNNTLYTSGTWNPPASYEYLILKKNFSPDSNNDVDVNFDGILLDANLVYVTVPEDSSLYGKLISLTPSGNNLTIQVGGQSDFVVTNYATATYPYYSRNTEGSLLVVGKSATAVLTKWLFNNCYFEPSTITKMDRAWRGVTSLSFNGSTPLTGYIEFYEGYQVGLTPNELARTLKITVAKNVGTPIGCERIFGEDVPDDCGSLLSYINGAYARTDFGEVNLLAGNHVAIYPDPDRHRIYIGLTFNETDVCTAVPPRPVAQI